MVDLKITATVKIVEKWSLEIMINIIDNPAFVTAVCVAAGMMLTYFVEFINQKNIIL